MHTYSVTRRVGPVHKPPKAPSTWAEKILSLLLVAASLALGLACVAALMQTFQPSLVATSLPVRLEGKASDAELETVDGIPKVEPAAKATTAAVAGQAAVVKVEAAKVDVPKLRTAAKVLDPEIMEQIPAEFDSGLKNPCWTAANGVLKCLPYFYITGMFHAGAASLSEKLRQHPKVVVDACSGCQFWGEEGKAMGFYLDNLKETPKAVQQDPAGKILMDSSASTFAFYWAGGGKAHRGYADSMRPCWRSCVDKYEKDKVPVATCMSDNCYNSSLAADKQRATDAGIDWSKDAHNPLLVRAVYGDRPPKMILVARDPIARIYSAFHGYPHYHGKYGKNSAGFTAYVEEQVAAFRTCAQDFGADTCALYFEALSHREEMVYFHADQLMRGMYGLFLEIWYRFIPSSNWLVIHSDDLFQRPKETLKRVVDFLELPTDEATLEKMTGAGIMKSFTSGQEPIEPRARQLLADLYAPYNTKLAQLTGDSRFEKWNEQPKS